MAYAPSQSQSSSLWDSKATLTTKTYSTSSRSTSYTSNVRSTYSSTRPSTTGYEAQARIYHDELKQSIADILAKEAEQGPNQQRKNARLKLGRLNMVQFHELAMDVYDEQGRRHQPEKSGPFLAVRDDFHPRRNQARQKLATLPTSRFKDLASDIYSELNRRYPQFQKITSPALELQPGPPPQPSKSTNIVPVMGVISVEPADPSDDEASRPNTGVFINESRKESYTPNPSTAAWRESANFQSLDSLMADLDNMVGMSKSTSGAGGSMSFEQVEKIRSEYEHKLSQMTKRIQQLEYDATNTKDLNTSGTSEKYDQLDKDYKRLDQEHSRLKNEYSSQQEAVYQVKQDTQRLIIDLKTLSSKTAALDEEKIQLENQLRVAKEEAKTWQTKYENANQEINYLKGISTTNGTYKSDMIKENFLQPTREGVISQASIISYQTAINELLETARSSKPSDVLITMKTVIMISKTISENVEAFESSPQFSSSMTPRLHELKVSFSTTLTQLLASAKGHAMGMGMSPVSLLDASAGHLTAVVVDMAKLLGLSSQDNGEKSSATKPIPSSSRSTSLQLQPQLSSSLASTTPSSQKSFGSRPTQQIPQQQNSSNMGPNQFQEKPPSSPRPYLDPEGLNDYLKEETDHIVQAIQNLLAALRSPNQITQVQSIIYSINAIVTKIVEMSSNTFSTGPGLALAAQGDLVLGEMAVSKSKLVQLSDSAFAHSPEKASAAAKRDLAKEAYEIAKYIKELISIVERVIG
ncbi:hypothetical protein CLU79DRAFT_777223 [Phycomyces nitens]|nr:hypothetical protein CLU79DRAFT_777223 [Phycomyces nitens]